MSKVRRKLCKFLAQAPINNSALGGRKNRTERAVLSRLLGN